MKRITTLLLVALFAVGGMAVAQAESNIDVKVKGRWDFSFGFVQHRNFTDKHDERQDDNFIIEQRIRTQVNFIVSENLQAVLQFEIGEMDWGRGGSVGQSSGAGLGADGVNVETKHAYLDWMVPETGLHFRMGLQPLMLPNILGSAVFDDDIAAVVANYQINEMFGLTVFWARPYDHMRNDGPSTSIDDEMDAFGIIVPVTLEGLTITPWFVYVNVGSYAMAPVFGDATAVNLDSNLNNTSSVPAWWLGMATEVTLFDPLTFGLEFNYGYLGRNTYHAYATETNTYLGNYSSETRGWYLAANLNYTLDWGVPGIFGWYSSGDKASDVANGKFGRMPTLSPCWTGSSFGYEGYSGIGDIDALGLAPIGTWGIGLQIADMSFIEDLSHTLKFLFIKGTNDADTVGNLFSDFPLATASDVNDLLRSGFGTLGSLAANQYLTTKDYAYEVNFDHTYQIYENLAAVLELGFIHMERSESVWGKGFQDTNAWRAQLEFQFTF